MKALGVLGCLSIGFSSVLVSAGSASAVPTEWSYTNSPHGSGERSLFGVSCVRSDMCVAIGRAACRKVGTPAGCTLFESWNGSQWSVVPSPKRPSYTTYLGGVSCATSQFCVAAGYDSGSTETQTVIETWNGTNWSVTPSPNVGGDYLYGVSCANPTFCVAVGRSVVSSSQNAALIESWNGSQWSVVSSPSEETGSYLSGVSCTSATSCVADGWAVTTSGSAEGLIESWNGTSWSIMSSPNLGSGTELSAVSCASSVSCMAVGTAFDSSPNLVTVAESWNGSEWTLTPTPNPATYDNLLNGVSCTSGENCVAVGQDDEQSAPAQTLIESWNGNSWSTTPSPDRGSIEDGLSAVSCPQGDHCVAVGYFTKQHAAAQALVETGTAA
jgi:hypothetical protein